MDRDDMMRPYDPRNDENEERADENPDANHPDHVSQPELVLVGARLVPAAGIEPATP